MAAQNRGKNIRLFKNSFLEMFTHVHPIVPLLVWGPVVILLSYQALVDLEMGLGLFSLLALSGFLFWTLSEYILHRFIFHYHPTSKFGQRIVFLFHGIHHDDPDDATRLVMPPVVSIFLGVLHWVVLEALLGPVWVKPFFAFLVFGYLCYDYIHFAVHHFKPRTVIGRTLKQNHMLHHFATPDLKWGVSSPLWDYVFGTFQYRESKVSKSRLA